MANYDDFKTSGVKGQESLDALFILEATVDTTVQNATENDTFDLFDIPAGTAVIGVGLYGKGEDEASAHNIQIGSSTTANAILDTTDIKAEDINSYSAGQGVYFPTETEAKVKFTTDATHDTTKLTIKLVCVTM